MEEIEVQSAAQIAAQNAALQRLKQRSLVALERAGKKSLDITPPTSSSHGDGDSRNHLEDYLSETSHETSHKVRRDHRLCRHRLLALIAGRPRIFYLLLGGTRPQGRRPQRVRLVADVQNGVIRRGLH
jgi:hypothetical protein